MISQVNMGPQLPIDWPESLDDMGLYRKIRFIANKIFRYAHFRSNPSQYALRWLEDWREEEHTLNPQYGRTERGVFLVLRRERPSRLWTPWGRWDFGGDGGGPWDEVHEDIFRRFGAVKYCDIVETYTGEPSSVYGLYKIGDGAALPRPRVLKESKQLLFEPALYAWDEMTRRYRIEQSHRKGKIKRTKR